MMFLVNSPLSLFKVSGKSQRAVHHVLRNTLNADFLNWYQQFPLGKAHVLKFYGDGQELVGQATVLIQSWKGNRYANLVNVDASVDTPSTWTEILRAAEQFLRSNGVTHINTLASFEPFRQALKENGYCRVNRLPLWVCDKNKRLSGTEAWHITAIEGDLGYLFE